MILLFSGGIDSYIAWHYLNKPATVYFNLGTPYSGKELFFLKRLIKDTIIESPLNLSIRQQGHKAYVPFRNLYLAMLAVHYDCHIVMAGLKDDYVSDKNPYIFSRMSSLLSDMEGRRIEIVSPFWDYTKAEIVAWYLKEGYDPDNLTRCVSCYSEGASNYCGKCPACFRKWNALWVNGIQLDFANHDLMEEYLQAAMRGKYDEARNQAIITAIGEFRKDRASETFRGH